MIDATAIAADLFADVINRAQGAARVSCRPVNAEPPRT
jgi:hypothetical protein